MRRSCLFSATAAAAGLVLGVAAAQADDVASFYRGKTLTLIIPGAPGGVYGTAGQMIERHLEKQVTGGADIVLNHMPGAGGVKAANYLYSVAPKDGTMMATLLTGVASYPVLQPDRVRYDPLGFAWLGAWGEAVNVLSVLDTAPAKTLEEAKKTELVLGALGKASTTYQIPALLNTMLGTKFNIVLGYRGGTPIRLAIEQGELHGWAGLWLGWKARKPDWVRDNRLVHLVQLASRRAPDLPDVPTLVEFARNDEERQIFEFMSFQGATARAVQMPPGVPAARVDAMTRAVAATFADPAFQAEMNKRNFTVTPIPGDEVYKVVKQVMGLPPPLVARLKSMIGLE